MSTSTHEEVTRSLCDAVVEASNGITYVLELKVSDEDRTAATACAERHQHNNRAFANAPKFNRGKGQFDTIVRGYLGEIVVRKAIGAPHGIDDLVFDKPQKRPDLMSLAGHAVRLDMKTTEDHTARINQETHFNGVKRPFAYLLADVCGDVCHLWVVDADAVDKWDLKSHPSPHYICALPVPPTA